MIKIYKIESKAFALVKKILDEQERVEMVNNEKKIIFNEFARAGYTMRDGKSMGFKEEANYLYIKADDEFFKKNEKRILIDGVKKLEGADFEKVRKEIEKETEGAEIGMGAVFGEF
jgi:hypothetical protein